MFSWSEGGRYLPTQKYPQSSRKPMSSTKYSLVSS